MKNFIENIKADRLTFRGFVISAFLTLLTAVYILVSYTKLSPLVPVFNQLPWGHQRLVGTPGIFLPVILFSFLFIFNIIFSSAVYPKNPLIARIVASVTLLLSIINFIFIIRTILLIT